MGHMRVNIRQLHEKTGAIVDLAAAGEVVTVVRQNVPVAEIWPIRAHGGAVLPDREALLQQYPALGLDSGLILEEDRS